MKNLTFYTNPLSRGRVVRWALEECGANYETVLLDFSTIKNPSYLAVNPMGKIPSLKHGDTVITEAAAICMYLADIFPEKSLSPSINSIYRGEYYRWLFFTAATFEAAVMEKYTQVSLKDEYRKALGYGDLDTVLNTLRNHLSDRKYICAEQFSIADIVLTKLLEHGIYRAKVIEPEPVFQHYLDTMQQRPAYQKAKYLDDLLVEN
ncbi:hypothetical protein BKG91_11515 [Rodentibacter caecimuris]|uniref:Glutathione S-transferase n=1 Tax=Rodentibacter caecimuris TaxID=1796644 RepID=A0AAJ3K4Y7_9PAST|nr:MULTISPECIES: glutathione S-transferase family protein [Pasteurellaceae]AOF53816.1 Glutathione S-transferase [Pasteurellaceae bacterium NI1060]MCQ9124450.1 glutathione S-transferase family protein [Rodentibacter heylii]MCR1837578.1 glutathione S-transferase family protein [Pasteurella caecimuris]MCU0107097.1 glutathione S-transferase family protein [Pasteurella caecimuris]MCX2960717.1 glutathione S-transferase family protein [Rodentibacter heylii]